MSRRVSLSISAAIILGALSFLGSSSARAAVPDSVNYQGVLKTPGGSPVPDGSYNVTFKIYDVATGPNPALWTETKSVSTMSGSFSTLLGSVTPLLPSIFSGPSRFLGISVNADPEMTPRTAIVAVPYAYRIATVDGASGGVIRGSVAPFGGNLILDTSTASSGNILKDGGAPFIHNFGTENTFIGVNAGNLTMTGLGNTASGFYALNGNTTGLENTATGRRALCINSTGMQNTASGFDALYYNTTGNWNTASGAFALYHNTTGTANTANGVNALMFNTIGNGNAACGFNTLYKNSTGSGNSASGAYSLYENTIGDSNTASGSGALRNNTTGIDNVACGAGALGGNTTGMGNVACGAWALGGNTTGLNNTASGFDALRNNTTGFGNTASGGYTLNSNSTGDSNTACGGFTLSKNTTGGRNTAIGYAADVSSGALMNATAIGANAVVNASNKIRLGDAAVTVIEGQVAYTFTSDKNQKENFHSVDGDEVLRKIREIGLSSWNYKGQDPQQFRHYGPMAQEFFAAFGHDGVGQCGDSVTINSGDMAGIMMIAIQTLTAKNKAAEAENAQLRTRLGNLENLVLKLATDHK